MFEREKVLNKYHNESGNHHETDPDEKDEQYYQDDREEGGPVHQDRLDRPRREAAG